MPSVSVIIPLYNVQAYIRECLQSLLDQDCGDFEAICIDDGSTDATLQVARSTVGDDGRFTFIGQENAGQSAARNVGIGRARGEWLLFLDSDDYCRADTIGSLLARSRADDLDYLDFSAQSFYEDDKLRGTLYEAYDDRDQIEGVMPGTRLFVEYQRRGQYHCSPCLHFFKRELLDGCGLRFDEGHIHEDELFSPILIAQARRAAFMNEPFYQRRIRAGSSMTSARGIRDVQGTFFSMYKLREWLDGAVSWLEPDEMRAYAQRVFELAELLTRDIFVTSEAELDAFAGTLPPAQAVVFEECRCLANHLAGLLNSHSFKVGHALMRGPSWVKRKLQRS